MAVSKITTPPTQNELVEKTNEIIDVLGTGVGANTDLSNLSEIGEKHFINKSQVTNCILEMPTNGITYSGNTVTLHAGVKGLAANGVNADGTVNNIEWEITEAVTITLSDNSLVNGAIIYRPVAGDMARAVVCYVSDTEPPIPTNNAWHCWDKNGQLYYVWGNGGITTWTPFVGTVIATNVVMANSTRTSIKIRDVFQAADSQAVVNKSGDTMDGNLIIKSDSDPIFATSSTSVLYNQAPNANANYGGFECQDSNGKWMSIFGVERYTDNHTVVKVQGCSHTGAFGRIQLISKTDGSWYAQCPPSDVASSILTTAAISKAANGYVKLGNGVIIQWGRQTPTADTQTFTLPVAFTTNNYSIGCVSTGGNGCPRITGSTSTTFVYSSANTARTPFRYIAIGY